MKYPVALALGLLAATTVSWAAGPKPVFVDHSMERLIDPSTAQALWAAGVPAKVWKVYPASKWGFLSQVEGGITQGNTCVVTARAMMAPLTVTKKLLFRPEKMATTFDAIPNATSDQCKQLAKEKLKQAIEGVVSSLVRT